MADRPSASPSGVPRLPERIADGLREAAAYPDRRPTAYISLIVTGGVRGERYEFEFTSDAAGNVSSRLLDELKTRDVRESAQKERRADPDQFRRLVESIDADAIVRADRAPTGFPPDSIVGSLELNDGEQMERLVFLADEAQAARGVASPPEPLLRAVDAIYSAAASYLNVDDPRP